MQDILKLMSWTAETGGEMRRQRSGNIEVKWSEALLDVFPDGKRWTARCISMGPLRVTHCRTDDSPFGAAVCAVGAVAEWLRKKAAEASEIEKSLAAKVAAAEEPQ